jgi:SpoIVB peptidase S55
MAALLGALVASAPFDLTVARAGGRSYRPDTLPVEQVRRGMKGYGLTVFEGTQPERFEVEVIDVIKNYLPAQDIILIKTHHPRLDVTNSVQGMSGSPIFIEGKMVGAYSYGWSFGKEPVAGVTPIQNMIDDIDRPLPKQSVACPLRRRSTQNAGAIASWALRRSISSLGMRRSWRPMSPCRRARACTPWPRPS